MPGDRARMLQRIISAVRAVAGMPDYQAYVAHLRRCHPERPVPSERLFYDEFVKRRYGDGPTRCC
jgi:uncharacterized short protein YbdD (DUF466 family)